MARTKRDDKKEKKIKEKDGEKERRLSEETIQGIIALVCFVLAVFFSLSAFNKGGKLGGFVYTLFISWFGLGYYLLPILFLTLAASFFKSLKKKVALTHTIGGLLFFGSGLALLHIISSGRGGVVGSFIGNPLVTFIDVPASIISLLVCVIISFLIMFDAPLRFDFITSLFTRKQSEEDAGLILDDEPKIQNAAQLQELTKESDKKEKEAEKQPTKKTSEKDDFVVNRSFNGKEFIPPPLSLLEKDSGKPGVGDIKANSNIIKRTLFNFGINVEMDEISIGPSITRYALKPAEGVRLTKIVALQSNLELALAASPVRIEAPIPGKSLVGIEVPNSTKTKVGLGSLLASPEFQEANKPLTISLGKGISGMSHFTNLAKAPHMLIAGATGSGKSVTIHTVITSLLFRNSPDNLKFIMVDPKRVELTLYNGIPHLLTPVITDAKKAILALKWAGKEMDRRYDVLQAKSLQNIESYHKNVVDPEIKKRTGKDNADAEPLDTMPYIVIVIDELADIMQAYPRELESGIVRLAQMSRAVGIHLILSTQRPSVNVITGLIKANIPSRIALQVSSQIDSRTILDMAGAEKLLGAGDMLYLSGEMSQPQRIQSAYISEDEVKTVVKYLADSYGNEVPSEIDLSGKSTEKNVIFESSFEDDSAEEEDDLYDEARQTVIEAGKASTSYLQRKLGIGYARAARLIDILEERGVIGPGSGAKPREVLERSAHNSEPDMALPTEEATSDTL